MDTVLDKKIDNVQDQLDVMHREDAAFKGYVHRQFEIIVREVATKEDLYQVEARVREAMATKEDLYQLEARIRIDMATKDDLHKLTEIVLKIAEKVGVKI